MPVEASAATYPGSAASSAGIFCLAEEYRRAAKLLRPKGGAGGKLSQAPYRLAAIHAIELYLNAFLLDAGSSAGTIRGYQHDFAARANHAAAAGLVLRKRTLGHLISLADRREYLVTRYDPDPASRLSEINRLQATLEEVRSKVALRLSVSAGKGQGQSGELGAGPAPDARAQSR